MTAVVRAHRHAALLNDEIQQAHLRSAPRAARREVFSELVGGADYEVATYGSGLRQRRTVGCATAAAISRRVERRGPVECVQYGSMDGELVGEVISPVEIDISEACNAT